MDREDVLRAVYEENWTPVLDWLHQKKRDISRDDQLKFAADIVTSEFFRKLPEYPVDRADVLAHLVTLLGLHWGRLYNLPPEQYKLLIVNLAQRNLDNAEQAYQYAIKFPEEEACRRIIESHKQRQPQPVAHSQHHTIQVTQQPQASQLEPEVDHRIPLFKSYQEKQLFQAIKNAFPSHHVYPNVAISCLLDWPTLQEKLSAYEKDLFFKGIVDFVIFDQAQDYMPVYFFELDSPWHDNDAARRKDQAKDAIFAKAGLRLLRVRKLDHQISEGEFTAMIREVIGSAS